jgi:O-antigen/teichoic acid export membrane protein
MIALRFADRSIGLLSTIVLARLLVPADFGLVALATAMVAAVAVLGEFGFDTALIQNQRADRSHYDTAWTLGLVRGLVACCIIALLAEPMAIFFEDPRLTDLILALALVPLLEGFYNIGTVAFRKDLTLNKEFLFRILPRLAGAITTAVFAFAWRDYWALVCGILAGTVLRLVISYVMHDYRPRLSVAASREIMGFSKWLLISSVTFFGNQKVSTFIIAKFLDAGSLGIFSIANQISNLAAAELIAPVKQAIFPAYAKLAHDAALLRKAFLDVYGILVLLALPVAIGIGLTAEFFVPILLGPKWTAAVPLIEILVISGGLRSLSTHVQPVYLAMKQPQLGAYASIGRSLVSLPVLLFVVLHYGIMGAAIVEAFGQVSVLASSMYLMHRMIQVGLYDIWKACWRGFLACGMMILAVGAVKMMLPISGSDLMGQLVLLAITVLVGVLVYVSSVLLMWQLSGRPTSSAESYLLAYLNQTLRFRRTTPAQVSSSVGSK